MKEETNIIMIIDDSLIDQMLTTHVINKSMADKELLVMQSAYEALAYLKRNEGNPGAIPSLILLDLDMPGMNGFEFMQQFKMLSPSLTATCRVIVITGSDIPADVELIQADPYVSKLITKPLCKNELIPII